MMAVISVGNGAIANEVLKKTKGHELGLGFVAIAYGLAFFLAISMFGHISAGVSEALSLCRICAACPGAPVYDFMSDRVVCVYYLGCTQHSPLTCASARSARWTTS